MKNNPAKVAVWVFLVFLLQACQQKSAKSLESMGKDTLEIWVDTSLSVLINEHKKAFENQYNNPFISIQCLQESQIVEGLMSNKFNCAVLQRNLTVNETKYLKDREDFVPKQYTVAYDAFTFVVNNDNPRETLSISEIQAYFRDNKSGDFQLVFESNHCQAVPYFQSYFQLTTQQVSAAYTKSSLNELISYIGSDKRSIGIIPFSYISDIEAASTVELLKNLKVLSVVTVDSKGVTHIFNPSQESITTKDYPLVMPIVLLNCNMEKKSGTTFVNYIMKPKAQRLFLKCGVVPAIFPAREVNVK